VTYCSSLYWFLGLDAGTAKKDVIPEVFLLTHSHDDHMAALPYYSQHARHTIQVYCPKRAEPLIDSLLKAHVLLHKY
jgi:Cft2 family RNA processing exonuclease